MFLDNLFATGAVAVLREPLPAGGDEGPRAREILRAEYDRRRVECPGLPPRFDETAALTAGRLFHNGCVCLVNRALAEADVQAALALSKPLPGDAATSFSLDLLFVHLASLLQMAEGAAPGDPLVTRLRELAAAHPLSSVGIRELDGLADEGAILGHPALRRLYADRIIAHRDEARLGNPEALGAVRESLGTYTNLWPELEHRARTNTAGTDDG